MVEKPDYIRGVGGAALGARLRRLSERIDRDTGRIYAAQGIRFEQRWFGVLNQLVMHGPMTVGDIASALGITHVSVSQSSRSLEKEGLIASAADPADARRRKLVLTDKGQDTVRRLTPLWNSFSASAAQLNAEAGDVTALLDRLDDALDRKSLFERMLEQIGGGPRSDPD